MKSSFFTIFIILVAFQASYAQWSEQNSGVTTSLNSVSAIDNNYVWVCGASGKVLVTVNGGTTWTAVTSPNASLTLYHVWGVDSNTALVAGSNANTFLYKTTNRGVTWTQTFTQTGGFIDAIAQRISPSQLLMMGNPVAGRWSIWESTDYGSTWDSSFALNQMGTETGYNNSLYLHPQLAAWFGTNNTRVYKRSSMGYTSQPTPGLVSSQSVWFNDGNNGMTGGAVLLKTTNAGTAWLPLTAPGTGTILGITGVAMDWWYCRGGAIYHSSNNGTVWAPDFTAPSGTYNHLVMARGGSYMWAIRNNGGISRSLGPNGIIPISSEVPDKYSLHQNYPNPFNPSTVIRFQVAGSMFIKLRIYDILGKEVATLVNRQLNPGTYEVNWNAANYPSGIYFYKLEAGAPGSESGTRFTETKRMVLVK